MRAEFRSRLQSCRNRSPAGSLEDTAENTFRQLLRNASEEPLRHAWFHDWDAIAMPTSALERLQVLDCPTSLESCPGGRGRFLHRLYEVTQRLSKV